MKLGIVGPEQAKFTPRTERLAREAIRDAIRRHGATAVVSGRCPLGGVDLYAEDIAADLHLPAIVHAPRTFAWAGAFGYKARNLRIAAESDLVLVVALRQLPPGFRGVAFEDCYHCGDRNPRHVKSGGCWTAWQCKRHEWVFIQ